MTRPARRTASSHIEAAQASPSKGSHRGISPSICRFKRGMHQSDLCSSQTGAQLSTKVGSQADTIQERG